MKYFSRITWALCYLQWVISECHSHRERHWWHEWICYHGYYEWFSSLFIGNWKRIQVKTRAFPFYVMNIFYSVNSWTRALSHIPTICFISQRLNIQFFLIMVQVQACSLISSRKTYQPTSHFTPSSLDLLISVTFQLTREHTALSK